MYLIKVMDRNGWSFYENYYEYADEKQALDVARRLAEQGVECMVLKPYKRFEKPKPEVVELDV